MKTQRIDAVIASYELDQFLRASYCCDKEELVKLIKLTEEKVDLIPSLGDDDEFAAIHERFYKATIEMLKGLV